MKTLPLFLYFAGLVESVVVCVCVPKGKNKTVDLEVLSIEKYNEYDAPIEINKAPHIIRKCSDDEVSSLVKTK